jgi:membrane-bound ClpP family serine protease
MSVLFWPSLFLFLGLLLLVVEVFIPSGGLIGLCAVACLVLCLWYAFQQSIVMGAMFMLVDLVVLPLTAALAFSLWSKSPLGRRFFLSPPSPEELAVSHADHHLEHLVGRSGRAITPLRPSGHVEVDGRRADALAEEGFLTAGSTVMVMRVRSGQLVVRGLRDQFQDPRVGHEETLDHSRPETGRQPRSTTAEAVSILEEAP